MHTKRSFSSLLVAAALGTSAIATPALAQSYPSRAITLVIPFPPGGGADVLCRLVADKLRASLGQQLIMDNRPGGGGNIGAEAVARASPDGHTLLCAPDPIFTSHLLYSKLAFDPRAFDPVGVFALFSMGMVGRVELPFGNVSELIAYARAHPGKLTYASQGVGHFGHLMMEDLKLRAGLDILHVPYRGGVLAVNDMLAGQVDLLTGTLVSTISQINAGKLKLLAPTGERRLAAFPNVPALPEAVPGLSADSWLALAAPSGTPKEVTAKLSAAVAQAVQVPDLKARFAELHSEPMGTTPEQMRELIRRATEQWGRVIAATKISLE